LEEEYAQSTDILNQLDEALHVNHADNVSLTTPMIKQEIAEHRSFPPQIAEHQSSNVMNDSVSVSTSMNTVFSNDMSMDVVHRVPVESVKTVKREKVSVKSWNCYAVIFWLNRVSDGKFCDSEYNELRKMIIKHELKGSELIYLNCVALRFGGVADRNDQKELINAIDDLMVNDNFVNLAADLKMTKDEEVYCDPILFEVMNDPVMVMKSGYTYERSNIEQYIRKYGKDPISGQEVDLNNIAPNHSLKKIITLWKKKNM